MAKMFYTTEEAAAKLNCSTDQLKQMVSDQKLREFRDGARVMFKVDQVDRIASESKPSGDSGLDLAPVDTGDSISLADSGVHRTPAKEDTVVTGPGASHKSGFPLAGSSHKSKSGISLAGSSGASATGVPNEKASVFEEGEVKAADTGAQTRITPAVEDQLQLEGVGSGSGLLDLTRESDDTSLGAELLDEIYPGADQKQEGGIGSASGIFEQPVSPEGSSLSNTAVEAAIPSAVPVAGYDVVEEADSTAGAFGGLALAAAAIMGFTVIVVLAMYMNFTPSWLESIYTNQMMGFGLFAGGLVVLAAIFALIGLFVGKATAR